MLSTFEISKTCINLIGFDRNFDHPHINAVTFVHSLSTMKKFYAEKHSIDIRLQVCPHFLVKVDRLFLKNCYFIVVSFKN